DQRRDILPRRIASLRPHRNVIFRLGNGIARRGQILPILPQTDGGKILLDSVDDAKQGVPKTQQNRSKPVIPLPLVEPADESEHGPGKPVDHHHTLFTSVGKIPPAWPAAILSASTIF